jgi:hypothetical protein
MPRPAKPPAAVIVAAADATRIESFSNRSAGMSRLKFARAL